MYLQAAQDILQDLEDKILFTYSLMQEGEAYHFVCYYKDQMRVPTNQWDWNNFEMQLEKCFLPADIAKAAYEELCTLKQDKMDANTYLVKLTDLVHQAKITDKATIINFIKNLAKITIIECIYSSGNIPSTVKEYRKHIIILDKNNKHIESLKKGFTRSTNTPSSTN